MITFLFIDFSSFLILSLGLLILVFSIIYFSKKYTLTKNKSKKDKTDYLNTHETYLQFVEDISHELKTPLFSIQGYIETLLETGAINDISVRDTYLKNIYKASDRLMNTIKDLDTIHDLKKENLHLFYSSFDLCELINEVYDLLSKKAKEHKVILRKPNMTSPILVYADKNRIFQVFSNLVSNAIIYSGKENIVTINILDSNKEWKIIIEDAGIGISKEDLKHIFKRFYRADKSRSSKISGSGLGLAIVDKILITHKKTITAKSILKEGSTFTFKLDKG